MQNNNNPFEVGNKKRKSDNQPQVNSSRVNPKYKPHTTQQQTNKKSSSAPKVILGIIIALVILFTVTDMDYYIYSYMYERDEKKELKQQEKYIEYDYTYDFADFKGSLESDPFPETMPLGEKVSITKDHEKFIKRDSGNEMLLVVGTDVKPGLYTIDFSGNGYMDIDLAFDSLYLNDAGVLYNVPLVEGDKIEARYGSYSENFEAILTPQTEYVNFEAGLSGIFAYGRSNFEPQVEVGKYEYDEISYNYYSQDQEYLKWNYFYDEDVTINGLPGSYFIIIYASDQTY